MGWLSILKALLGLASGLTTYLQQRQLIEAGQAQAINEGLKNAKEAIHKANAARADAVTDFDKRNGLPDDSDPNLRD